MTSCSILSTVAAFFLTANLIVCIKMDAPAITSISTPLPETSTTSPTTIGIEPLPKATIGGFVIGYLTPDMFSYPDPLTSFMVKATQNLYIRDDPIREDMRYMPPPWKFAIQTLEISLKRREFPRSYQPYARLLSSLLTCLSKLHRVSIRIRRLQLKYSAKSDYPPLPAAISTPELRDLFSTDVFSDPDIPTVLLKKILKIPDNRIPDVKADLVKILDTLDYVKEPYYEYMHFLRIFLQDRDDIYRLRHEDAEIRRRLQKNRNIKSEAGG